MNSSEQRFLNAIEVALVVTVFLLLNRWVFKAFVSLSLFTPEQGKTVPVIFILSSISLLFILTVMILSVQVWHFDFQKYGISLTNFPTLRTIGKLILISAVGQAVIALTGEALEHATGQASTVPQVPNIQTLLIGLALSFIGGGIREELFFRGYLITRIPTIFENPKMGRRLAIASQLLLFGWTHYYQGYIGMTQTTLGAILFTWVYISSGNLWHSIIVHSFYDVWGFALIFLGY